MTATPLPPRCGSWVITRDGQAIQETWHKPTADRFARQDGVTVYSALEWLQRVNGGINE